MVKGLDTFRKYFEKYEEQYVLIGGAACDIVFDGTRSYKVWACLGHSYGL